MHICYIDESGCLGSLPNATSPIQPVLVVTGLFLDRAKLPALTADFLELKARNFPGLAQPGRPYLDGILAEIKGSDLRKAAAASSRRQWRHAMGFLQRVVRLLKEHEVRIVSRVWVKGIAQTFNGQASYAFSIQNICESFENYLAQVNDLGFVIADNRRPSQNRNVSHSIFTQKFKTAGDSYPRILEMPTFGDSKNHAGLQICDLVCSSIIQPIAIETYCRNHVASVHVRSGYTRIDEKFGHEIKALQHRFQDRGRWRGGITVKDEIAKRSGVEFFRTRT